MDWAIKTSGSKHQAVAVFQHELAEIQRIHGCSVLLTGCGAGLTPEAEQAHREACEILHDMRIADAHEDSA